MGSRHRVPRRTRRKDFAGAARQKEGQLFPVIPAEAGIHSFSQQIGSQSRLARSALFPSPCPPWDSVQGPIAPARWGPAPWPLASFLSCFSLILSFVLSSPFLHCSSSARGRAKPTITPNKPASPAHPRATRARRHSARCARSPAHTPDPQSTTPAAHSAPPAKS